MSQGCPSVSHQLVAASIAFRRARKKFPKDYGVGSVKDTKTEVEWSRKNNNDQPASSSSAKCMSSNNDKSQCFCSPSVYSDDGPRYLSAKQSLSIKQSKCTCLRRNKKSFEESTRWANDQSAVGDVLDKVSTREHFIEDVVLGKSIDRYNHDVEVDKKKKNNNSTHLTGKKCTCCPISIKRRIETGPSKLDSVDLLYVASNEKHCHVKSMDNHECLVEDETLDHFSRRNRDDQELRRSCSKLDRSSTRKEEISSPLLGTCDPRSPGGINLDLLRSPEDHRPRLCHRYPVCPRHSCRQRCYSCQQKSERISNFLPVGCTCLSILGNRRGCSWKDHERIRTCRKKEDEEEEDENVRVIDHKDSISILMEKYKSRDAQDFTEERRKRKNRSKGKEKIGNRNEDSPISRILSRENRKDCMEALENSKSCDRCRCQENRLRWKELEEKDQEKILLLDDGRNRIRGEGDFYRRKKKPARSKFGVPWRHTF